MNSNIKVLDGGLSCDLFLNGNINKKKLNSDPLWVARVVLENPDEIKRSHIRFINSGCDIITTSSYQSSIQSYIEHAGVDATKAKELIGSTVDIAKEAIKESKTEKEIIISASISPYGAILHDMSEYTGSYVDSISESQFIEFHSINIDIFIKKGIKLFAIETFPALKEVLAALRVLANYPDAKAWVSFTTNDGFKTSYGDFFEDVYKCLAKNKQIVAVGVNCSKSSYVPSVLEIAKKFLGQHQSFVVYPNQEGYFDDDSGASIDLTWKNDIVTWLDSKVVGFIGGCCMVQPKDISVIRQHVDSWSPCSI